jgi:hypothetical protein
MRWVSRDGTWRVDRISLSLTGVGRDGWWYRVHHHAFYREARDWDGDVRLGVPVCADCCLPRDITWRCTVLDYAADVLTVTG